MIMTCETASQSKVLITETTRPATLNNLPIKLSPCVITYRFDKRFLNERMRGLDLTRSRFPVSVSKGADEFVVTSTCLLPERLVKVNKVENVYSRVRKYADYLLPYAIFGDVRMLDGALWWLIYFNSVSCVSQPDWDLSDYDALLDKQIQFLWERCECFNGALTVGEAERSFLFNRSESCGSEKFEILSIIYREECRAHGMFEDALSIYPDWLRLFNSMPWYADTLDCWALCWVLRKSFGSQDLEKVSYLYRSGLSLGEIFASEWIQQELVKLSK